MRYIPMSPYSIAEIEEQCRAAINRAPQQQYPDSLYDEVLEFYRWENDVLVAA